MNRLSLRIWLLLVTAANWLQTFAQDEDEDELFFSRRDIAEMEEFQMMDDMMGYSPFHIKFHDIIILVLIFLAIYVYRRIWKGCSYMIVALVLFYLFFLR